MIWHTLIHLHKADSPGKTELMGGPGSPLFTEHSTFGRHESLATRQNLTTMTSNDAQRDDLIVRDYQTVT